MDSHIEKEEALELIAFLESCAEEYSKQANYTNAVPVANSLRTVCGILRDDVEKRGVLLREWMLKVAVDVALAACRNKS